MVDKRIISVAQDADGRWLAEYRLEHRLPASVGARALTGMVEGAWAMRLHLVANNARFRVLGHRGETPNQALKILALNLDWLSRDGQEAFGHPAPVDETFVGRESRRADGSVEEIVERAGGVHSRAAGFADGGRMRGFWQVRGGFMRHAHRCLLQVREVVPGIRAVLIGQTTPWGREERVPAQHRLDLLLLPGAFDLQHMIAHVAAQVPDPRQLKQYSWSCLLAGLPGGVQGKQSMRDIAAWARSLPDNAIEQLGGRWKKGRHTVPAVTTSGDALKHTELGKLHEALRSWLSACAIVSACSVTRRAVHAQKGHTGDECVAVKTCLRGLNIAGGVVTGDALHTATDFIVAGFLKKSDYAVRLTANRPKLLAGAKHLDWNAAATAEVAWRDTAYGCREQHIARCIDLNAAGSAMLLIACPGAAQAVCIECVRNDGTSASRPWAYYLTCLTSEHADAQRLGEMARAHGPIGNGSHRIRDVASGEDCSRTGHLPEALAITRSVGIADASRLGLSHAVVHRTIAHGLRALSSLLCRVFRAQRTADLHARRLNGCRPCPSDDRHHGAASPDAKVIDTNRLQNTTRQGSLADSDRSRRRQRSHVRHGLSEWPWVSHVR